MIDSIKKLLGIKTVDFAALMAKGAKVIDVRTPGEFASGHVKGAVNVPLDQIGKKAVSLKKNETYILCCRSGMRSASATQQLKSMGFTSVYNAGPWQRLQ